MFVPLGCERFSGVLERLGRLDCDGVLMLLVGQDAVRLNRALARAGLDQLVRLSPLMDENMLLATGAGCTEGIYASAGYFETLPTAASLDFGARYAQRFGTEAPVLNSLGESCYEGLALLSELAQRAGTLDVDRLEGVASGVSYDSPRGRVQVRGRHLQHDVYLAKADGVDFDVLCTL
jgi:ABC-type branched-subunit amino acid transport system substrate-binding protein